MRWVTALKLEDWARTAGSRPDLGAVLADLCRASASDLAAIRFPSGDKGQVRGFDGHLESRAPAPNVPEGESIWEFGVDQDYRAKLLGDFNSRTADVARDVQERTTLVLVTPWTWDSSRRDGKLEDWRRARTAKSHWRKIIVIDGSALETWLDANPAVAAWHARNTFGAAPPHGVRSTDEFWSDFSGRFGPSLTEDVLLCERDEPAQRVVEFLLGGPGPLHLLADSPDEATAFTVAAIRKAKPEQRLFLEARTLVVDEVAAGRQLVANGKLILLLRGESARSPAQFAMNAPVIVPFGRQQRGRGALALGQPSGFAFGRALQTMGVPENEALTLARGCGRSLTALERLKPGGYTVDPAWMASSEHLLPLILAGSWDAANELDMALVCEIAGRDDYAALEVELRKHLLDVDPPFDLEGSIWKVRAPMDAFVRVGHRIEPTQARRLNAAMTTVFGRPDVNEEVDGVIHFPRKPVECYSGWLREGLATTLLLFAVWSETAFVNLAGRSGQAFADETFRAIPNLASDHRLWESLRTELPLLAEAAPAPFLDALEAVLEGETIKPLLQEKEGLLFPVSRLPPLLWALETTAWDPKTFNRSVELLGRLASIYTPGKSGTSPMNSLREIFLLWNPNTNATLDQRLGAVDALSRRHPDVAWQLLARLIPQLHDMSSPTAKPKLREGGAADRPPLKRSEYAQAQAAITSRAIAGAGDDPERWSVLVKAMANFTAPERATALAALDVTLDELEADGLGLWRTLRDETAKHERFHSAQWALSGADLAPWQALVRRHEPTDPVERAAALFDASALDDLGNEAAANARRAKVVGDLLDAAGVAGVVRLGLRSRLPFLVARAFGASGLEAGEVLEAFEESRRLDPVGSFTIQLAGLARSTLGTSRATEILAALSKSGEIDAAQVAAYLMAWPDTPESWSAARRLDRRVAEIYWRRHGMYYDKDAPRRTLFRALMNLRRAGHPIAALGSASYRMDDAPSRLLLELLQEIIAEVNTEAPSVDSTMLSHYVELALTALDARADVDEAVIANRELALLPLLRHTARPLRLHGAMARDPAIFISLLATLPRSDREPATDPDEETRARALRAYQILSEFHRLPGLAGQIVEPEPLGCWIDAVRTWASENGRAEAADGQIGRLLAHAPLDDDGAWPARAVRDEIERLASDRLEESLRVERFNMRGAHSREIYAGGEDERQLAATNRRYATACAAWPRTHALLAAIADGWDRHAQHEDLMAAQMKLRS